VKGNVYERVREFFSQLLKVLDYSINDNNFFHFDEILSQEKIDDIQRLEQEK
jgi:hypothetical protein